MKKMIQVVAFSMLLGLFLFGATEANAQGRSNKAKIYRGDGNRIVYIQKNGNRSYRRWNKSNNGRKVKRGYYSVRPYRGYRVRRVYRNGRIYYVRY